jgi:Domain of unknown function (DUF4112)
LKKAKRSWTQIDQTIPSLRNCISPEDGQPVVIPKPRELAPELRWVEDVTRLLDTKYRIPGTSIRFGADFLIGLIPGAGDLLSMLFSGVLIATMAKHGASASLTAKMLSNVVIDTLVGSIPILGNIFDLFYKANHRNLLLMREYYEAGRHGGSVWPMLIAILVVLVALSVVTIWLLTLALGWLWNLIYHSETSTLLNQ